MLALLAPLLGPVVKGVLGKVFKDKGVDADPSFLETAVGSVVEGIKGDPELNLELEKLALEKARILLEYEGKANEVPKSLQLVRGWVRPGVVISGWVLFVAMWMQSIGDPTVTFNPPHIITEAWLGLTAFWFVGRNREKGKRW